MDAWLQNKRGYLLLSAVYAIVLGAVLVWRQPAPAPIEIVEPAPRPTPTPVYIVVQVSGAVAQPGVYTLPENSRVNDAILAAGGLQPEADVGALNLATRLQDGQRLHVLVQGEAPPAAAVAPLAPGPAGQAGSLINVNAASAAELESLPGIGAVLAQRIVEDRQANGPYTTVDDLLRVRGIGPAILEDLRPLVSLH